MVTLEEALTRLAELSRMLDRATVEVAQLDELAVEATVRYEIAHARAYMEGDGSVEARKRHALLDVEQLLRAKCLAEVHHRACRERIRTLGVQIDVGRTLVSSLRAQWQAEGAGQ